MAAPSGFLTEVVEKVSFVNKWPMLLKATQDDETPTPGYLYNDITALTFESGSNCHCLVDFLTDRLDKNSCHVKYKVLKVMLHLVDHGHEAFSDRLRNKAKGIQLSTKYSGPPHPLHGMAPYVAVRKTAKELSEKLFDTEASSRKSSSQHTGRSGHMTQATRKMDGFGNSPISAQKPVTMESLGESVKEGLQHIASRLSGENKSSLGSSQSSSGYRALHGDSAVSSHYDSHGFTTQGFITSRSPAFHPHISESSDYTPVTLGNDDGDDDDGDDAPRSTGSRVMRTPASTKAAALAGDDKLTDLMLDSRGGRSNGSKGSDQLSGGSSDLSERLESVAVADWSQEVSLVEMFISNSENKQTPSKGELQQFVKRSSSLNCQKILDLLTASMKSSSSSQLRCLFGIEGIVKEDLVSSDVALALLSSHLSALRTSPERAIKSKALKILRQLERLEADTRLDQPVMTDAQLIPQPDLDLCRVEIPTDRREVQSTCDISSISNSVGSLFSGMSLAEKTPSTKSFQDVSSEAGLLLGGPPLQSPSSHAENSLLDSKIEGKESMSSSEDLLLSHRINDQQTREDSGIQQSTYIPPSLDINQVNFTSPIQQSIEGGVTNSSARVDPLMSREAGFAELWSSISPSDSPIKKPPKKPPLPSSAGVSNAHGSPLRSSAQPGLTPQQIASLYPQLSDSVLSGASSTPLNLAAKPTAGFGFVASRDGEAKQSRTSSTRNAFSFVQDAMKSGKK